ncbi:VPLPA-CTERM sorting domain-containing protein [Thioclava sp. GXIMD4216]|uniref:VPLPA-CTERM sorting domain-containing protein n=1 Tax=unclassified Thioclava TaxID=2621713 RepID=UPI0030D57CE7
MDSKDYGYSSDFKSEGHGDWFGSDKDWKDQDDHKWGDTPDYAEATKPHCGCSADFGHDGQGGHGGHGGHGGGDEQVSPVPLPAGGILLLGALGGFAALRRRKSGVKAA